MKRPAVLALVGLLLFLVVGPIVLLVVAGGPPGVTVPSGEVPGDSASTASALTKVPAAADAVEEGAWWRIGWRPMHGQGAPDWSTMTIGLLDGTILGEVALEGDAIIGGAGAPFVRGPHDGRIVYATQVAGRTELSRYLAEDVEANPRAVLARPRRSEQQRPSGCQGRSAPSRAATHRAAQRRGRR